MNKTHHDIPFRGALTLIASACLALSLTGCIQRDKAPDDSGSTTGGSTTGGDTGGGSSGSSCANLPSSTTSYKGGDTLGEELTLSIDPSSLAYTITIDDSEQRSAGTQVSGTLVELSGCQFTSDEAGAVFTIGANDAVQGGVQTVDGTSFAPLIAFGTTYNNASDPTAFNDVAIKFNVAGVQTTAGTTSGYGGSGRLRNAGTLQFCVDSSNGGFATYDSGCTDTEKGYITYNADRDAFDFYETDSTGSAVTEGGTLAGSMIIGMVNDVAVPVLLLRTSATDYGLRVITTQEADTTSGDADGSYLLTTSSGSAEDATMSGAALTIGTDTGTLAYNTPVSGVIEASGTLAGHLLYAGGVLTFSPTTSGAAAFEFGVQE
ncbi:hypothetical protein [Solimonas marina]|uniref:Uncharacterized protein n=1 Tax=Solimonas marina TaxID=2714601 RepID=A0A969W6H0_9GAMM|nr:hypothetical protein [Solimonas marina]NKF21467.1 hypothetical protein [Solimonas marina]